jgi:outer membrane receptor protein involved in Fe transport
MSSGENDRLPPRTPLAVAISTALAGTQAPVANAEDEALQEIIVTARKRTENLQIVPESIQAIPSDVIERAGLTGLEDTARFIPSLSYVAQAPGANKLIFRGVADTNRSFYSDTSAAIYLDEQPLTLPSQTPEPRQVDIERIEALAGPQGTLYGGSAQSGTLRIITNKPDPTRFETVADATVMKGGSSDFSYDLSGVVNVPLVEDKLALRLVGFSATDGGFIDNVLGPSPGFGTFNNSAVVEDNQGGEADYLGGRAALRWLVNDKWAVTSGIVWQDMDTTGNYDHEPERAGNLNKIRFVDEEREDQWTQLGLTVEGDLGFAQLLSATSYFTRDVFYFFDNTEYAAYLRSFYDATPGSPGDENAYYVQYAFGADPAGLGWDQPQNTRRISQEIRLSHDGTQWSWIAGLFYEHLHDHWDFKARLEDYESTGSFAYWVTYYSADPTPGSSYNTYWNNNNKTKTDQYAAFGELTWHLDDQWNFTAGGRWFTHKRDREYFVAQPANNELQREHPVERTSDLLFKGNIQYRIDDERMIYALYSEGFRNGGGNIQRPGAVLPAEFDPDFLQNYEVGFKSRWLDERVQVNITAFHMAWDDFQTEVEDTGRLFATMVVNAGDATIDGLEVDLSAVPVEGLDVGVNFTVLNAELKDDLIVPDDPNNPDDPNSDTDDPNNEADDEPETLATDGARLPITPEFKMAAWAQYTWQRQMLGGSPYVRLQYSFQGDGLNDLGCDPSSAALPDCTMDSYGIADAMIGLEGDTWEASFFVDNLGDEQAELYVDTVAGDLSTRYATVNRPREYGLRFMKKWGD